VKRLVTIETRTGAYVVIEQAEARSVVTVRPGGGATGAAGPPGAPGTSAPVYERRYDESGNYQYAGTAVEGSAEGAAVWTIRRLEYASGAYVSTTQAVDVTWTGRYGHTYA